MLGKLIKHEFKATGRIFLPIFAALLAVAAANRALISLDFEVPKVIGVSLAIAMMVAVIVVALIITLQRFYRNLLGSEGYLMFTLPVGADSLIWSKLLVASVWVVASVLVILAAVAVMAVTGDFVREVLRVAGLAFEGLARYGFDTTVVCAEGLALIVAGLFSSILQLYACMALGLLVGKHRVGFAFLMYVAFNIVSQIVFSTVIMNVWLRGAFSGLTAYGQLQTALGLGLVWAVFWGAVYYAVTRYMLKNRLNLE